MLFVVQAQPQVIVTLLQQAIETQITGDDRTGAEQPGSDQTKEPERSLGKLENEEQSQDVQESTKIDTRPVDSPPGIAPTLPNRHLHDLEPLPVRQ